MKKAKQMMIMLLLCCITVSLTACGGGLEKKILGSWVPADDDEGYFTFYSSGTVTATVLNEETETGTWEISDDDTLTITLYGDTVTVKVTKISSDSMTWARDDVEMELLKRD